MIFLTSVGSVATNGYEMHRFVMRRINRLRNNTFGHRRSVEAQLPAWNTCFTRCTEIDWNYL
jgi:hypothetical protein